MKQLAKPTPDELLAFARLKRDGDFERVIGYLTRSRERLRERCETDTEDRLLRQAQGASQAMRDVLELADEAREMLDGKR